MKGLKKFPGQQVSLRRLDCKVQICTGFFQFYFVLILLVSILFYFLQAWLKKAEDQGSAILLDAKDLQRAQDKLLIHKVCVSIDNERI